MELPKKLRKITGRQLLSKQDKWPPGLPDFVKDPLNFIAIQKALLDCLATTHSHAEMIDFSQCFPCTLKVREHKELMLKFGFDKPGKYITWKKIMENKMRRELRIANKI